MKAAIANLRRVIPCLHPARGRRIALILAAALLSGCAANADPILPTPPPTRDGGQPSAVAVSPTEPPTRTAQPTFTPLPPPSATPLVTATAGPSPTALIGATSRARPSPSLTPTRRAAQSSSLAIEYFTTDATTARPGDKIRVYWSVKGVDAALIYRLRADGARDFTWSVGQSGYQDVTIGAKDQDQARFVLTIGDAFGRLERAIAVPLAAACTQDPWFFSPPPDQCPAGPVIAGPAAWQHFERGLMLWSGAQGRIVVLYSDGKQPGWAAYADEFKDGMPERDGSLNPPGGLSQPIRGFGLIWRDKPGVRGRLGWATEAEVGFTGSFQADSTAAPDTVLYFQGPDGQIYALNGADSTWKALPSSAAPTPKP